MFCATLAVGKCDEIRSLCSLYAQGNPDGSPAHTPSLCTMCYVENGNGLHPTLAVPEKIIGLPLILDFFDRGAGEPLVANGRDLCDAEWRTSVALNWHATDWFGAFFLLWEDGNGLHPTLAVPEKIIGLPLILDFFDRGDIPPLNKGLKKASP